MLKRTEPKKPSKPVRSGELQLGRAVEWPQRPEDAQLDRVPNPQSPTDYLVRFTVPEFTSICPVTGQPDFAHLVIDYVPAATIAAMPAIARPLARIGVKTPRQPPPAC